MKAKFTHSRILDAVLAATITAGLQIEIWTSPYAVDPLLLAVFALLSTCPLAIRQTTPLTSLAAAFAGTSLIHSHSLVFFDNSAFTDAALMLALYSVGAHAGGRAARAGALEVLAVAVLANVFDEAAFTISALAFTILFLGGPWALGLVMRLRRAREQRLAAHALAAELDARTAVVRERARIARELHDVVAHAISVMVVQARGGERIARLDAVRTEQTLALIATAGEEALQEMRRLLGLLRETETAGLLSPQPSLNGIGALVEQIRESGVPVELAIEGSPQRLSAGVDVSAYRIVQEALTNVLRHAGTGAAATVRIRYQAGCLEIDVADDGTPTVFPAERPGHGMVGMRERVAMIGGALEVGPRDGGGFAVRAVLPIGSDT